MLLIFIHTTVCHALILQHALYDICTRSVCYRHYNTSSLLGKTIRYAILGEALDFYPRPVLAFGIDIACVCVCVCLSVCVCVSVSITCLSAHAITRDPFKLGSPNLDQRYKRPWLRSQSFWGAIDLDLQGKFLLKSQNLPHFELVRTITHYPFKLGSQNLDQMCKIAWLRSLLFLVAIDLDRKSQIWLKKSNFLVSPLLEIHNHHITTREPGVPRLLHRPDCCHGLHPLRILIYLDCFTVPTVSQSQHVARILI